MRSKSLVVLVAAFLLVASVAPAVATDDSLSVSVDQADDGSATATVTHNETAVENASVVVELNESDGNATYAGTGDYTTDENGTVGLPAPEENVTIDVIAEYENATAATTAELVVVEEEEEETFDSFGARVSWFVHRLIGDRDDGSGIGQAVAQFVLEHNPGKAPDHAGPSDGERGPPAFVQGEDTDGNETDGNATATGAPENPGKSGERGNGPPEDRGSNGAAKGNGK